MLYTFVTEARGSTAIDQYEGLDVREALRKWNRLSQLRPQFTDDQLFDEGRGGPTPVKRRTNTWCFTGINTAGDFFLVHIIATADRRRLHRPRAQARVSR